MLSNHPPAVKVGGRRLSQSSKAKPVVGTETQAVQPTGTESTATDYPRPTPTSDDDKEKKKQGYMDPQEMDKKKPTAESNHKKHVDASKSPNTATNKRDQATRISQPPGRGLEF
ncbi:hypothetical protein SCHPADRAFT_992210 [Schizopora paradoxa]|uniref:Uncharacterized protein n=1 Tax=Schizopora paradoxa TaxID=27342 RepID=A0A0H2S7A5_9AGAM|nr:hypothetical protein SCHPADRAFT_992210 [Schizopora paradoxa]